MDFTIRGNDFTRAGEAASKIKAALQLVGMEVETIRKTVIVAYEAELNIVIHARQGLIKLSVFPDRAVLTAEDRGPGIPDISLAMQEGYSTAPPHIRQMGFGAGMGLPNMKRCSDNLDITSEVNKGTKLQAIIYNSQVVKKC
jgi:anti-sigma regulatory factor (Ser/Thr protein kinase)